MVGGGWVLWVRCRAETGPDVAPAFWGLGRWVELCARANQTPPQGLLGHPRERCRRCRVRLILWGIGLHLYGPLGDRTVSWVGPALVPQVSDLGSGVLGSEVTLCEPFVPPTGAADRQPPPHPD